MSHTTSPSSAAMSSRSSSPDTPPESSSESQHIPIGIYNDQHHISSWFQSQLVDQPVPFKAHNWSHTTPLDLSSTVKRDDGEPMLGIEDLIEKHAYDDSQPSTIESSPVSDTPSLQYSSPPSVATADTASVSTFRSANILVPSVQGPVSVTKPIPPPIASFHKRDPAATQKVVYPPKESCNNLPILLPSIPEGGTKSRVETQVRVTLDLATALPSPQDPATYERVGSWRWLKLPPGTSTKRQSRKQGVLAPDPQDILYLNIGVTCATAPHNPVHCCTSCQAREAKRVAKKIAARVKPTEPSESDSPDEQGMRTRRPKKPQHEDTSSIVHFNCPDHLDFTTGSVVLPLRLTCYCRHHREKTGFHVHFSLVDYTGRTVGAGVSRPIMITDDHKTSRSATASANANSGAQSNETEFHQLSAGVDHQWAKAMANEKKESTAPSKRKSVSGAPDSSGPKRRAKPYDSSRSARVSREASVSSAPSPSSSQLGLPTRSPSPLTHPPQHPLALTSVNDILSEINPSSSPVYDIPPPSLDALFTLPEIPMPVVDDLGQMESPIFSTPCDGITPGAQSPSNPDTTPAATAGNMPFMFFPQPPLAHAHPAPPHTIPVPMIQRMIPACGPTHGGIEVTILGVNFHPALELRCVFGDVVSSITHRWSDNTLVCILPPRESAGVVHVWFEGFKSDSSQPIQSESLFTYSDESDRALMELALQVVGLKMTGKIEDAKNVAMRIVGSSADSSGAASSSSASAMGSTLALAQMRDVHPMLLSSGDRGTFEDVIIDFLAMLDLDMGDQISSRVSVAAAVSHQNSTGQSMLHLACMLGLNKLVQFLLQRGADVDARDRNGWTPLHFSALASSESGSICSVALLQAGADQEVVNAYGRTAQEEGALLRSLKARDEEDAWSEPLSSPRPRSLNEEDMWGDGEESEDEMVPRRTWRKKAASRTVTLKAPPKLLSRRSSSTDLVPISRDLTKKSDGKREKETEASSDAQKQAASFVELFQRTVAMLQQHAPETLKGLPIPQLPTQITDKLAMPAVPWGALPNIPNIPMVFPIFVPMIPGLPSLFGGEHRDAKDGAASDQVPREGGEATQSLGVLKAADWKAFWERWMTMTNKAVDVPPPKYTPRAGEDETVQDENDGEEGVPVPQASGSTEDPASSSHSARQRRLNYSNTAVPSQEVDSYAYQPPKKQQQKLKKKHDLMLVMFWIPTLLFSLLWAFYHGVQFTLTMVKDVIALRTGAN